MTLDDVTTEELIHELGNRFDGYFVSLVLDGEEWAFHTNSYFDATGGRGFCERPEPSGLSTAEALDCFIKGTKC